MCLIEEEIKKLKNNEYTNNKEAIKTFIKLTKENYDTLDYFEFLITKLKLFDPNLNYKLTKLCHKNPELLSLDYAKRILSSILYYSREKDKNIYKRKLLDNTIYALLENIIINNSKENHIRRLQRVRRKIKIYMKTDEYKLLKNIYDTALSNGDNIDYVLSNLEIEHDGIIEVESVLRSTVSEYDLFDYDVNIHYNEIVEKYGSKNYFTDYIEENLTEEETLTILSCILRNDRFHRQADVTIMENILNGNLLKLLSKIKIPNEESQFIMYR